MTMGVRLSTCPPFDSQTRCHRAQRRGIVLDARVLFPLRLSVWHCTYNWSGPLEERGFFFFTMLDQFLLAEPSCAFFPLGVFFNVLVPYSIGLAELQYVIKV